MFDIWRPVTFFHIPSWLAQVFGPGSSLTRIESRIVSSFFLLGTQYNVPGCGLVGGPFWYSSGAGDLGIERSLGAYGLV